ARGALPGAHVSGGRVELGLGAGWNEKEHAAFGFAFPETKERMNLLEEQLRLIRAIWTGDEPRSLPKPVQQPHPPIVMGGEAGPRAAALAARFADEYNVFAATPDECRERKARLDAACERIGRDPATLRFSLMATCIVGA